jgi:hypothetical protein
MSHLDRCIRDLKKLVVELQPPDEAPPPPQPRDKTTPQVISDNLVKLTEWKKKPLEFADAQSVLERRQAIRVVSHETQELITSLSKERDLNNQRFIELAQQQLNGLCGVSASFSNSRNARHPGRTRRSKRHLSSGIQMQEFALEVKENDAKMDEYLVIISSGLSELQQLAMTMNRELDTQERLVQDLDQRTDATTKRLDHGASKLEQLVHVSSQACTRCVVLALVVLLLSLIGYLIAIA